MRSRRWTHCHPTSPVPAFKLESGRTTLEMYLLIFIRYWMLAGSRDFWCPGQDLRETAGGLANLLPHLGRARPAGGARIREAAGHV